MTGILQLAGRILLYALKLRANLHTGLSRFVGICQTQLIPYVPQDSQAMHFVQCIYGFRKILIIKNVYLSDLCDGDTEFSEV